MIAESAKGGSTGIQMPELFCQEEAETQWWYYSGHLYSGARRLGYQLTFFVRRPHGEKLLGLVPLRWLSTEIHFAHFALSDISSRAYHYAHWRTKGTPSCIRSDCFMASIADWCIREKNGQHALVASTPMVSLELNLTKDKPVVYHGSLGRFLRAREQRAVHLSIPRLQSEGQIRLRGETIDVSGLSWMDREYGRCDFGPDLSGWDWFAIQLDNGSDWMLYHVRTDNGELGAHQVLTWIDEDGNRTRFLPGEFEVEVLQAWVSPWTGTSYPSHWKVWVPSKRMELEISPCLPHQEFDSRGSTCIIYWEGASTVIGTMDNVPVKGQAFVELVGYNQSHRAFARRNVKLSTLYHAAVDELRYLWHHRGITRRL